MTRSAKEVAERVLRILEDASLRGRQLLARAIDVEDEHRHRGPVGIGLPAAAALGRALQRRGDRTRAPFAKDTLLEVEGIARLHHVTRPLLPGALYRSGHEIL